MQRAWQIQSLPGSFVLWDASRGTDTVKDTEATFSALECVDRGDYDTSNLRMLNRFEGKSLLVLLDLALKEGQDSEGT